MKKSKEEVFSLENSYYDLPEMFYTVQAPSDVACPKMCILNVYLGEELGINLESEDLLKVFSGNKVIEDSVPISQAYAGHQFGNFTMLGDGRAVLLGEYVTKNGERLDIQLKGAGRTPYSRGGDGKASLGPMLREYIISEAMFGLGIPTTRSLAVVTTGESVAREEYLKGAILTRIAKSHIRVGTFQYAAGAGELEDIKELADYTLDRHFKGYEKIENKYKYLLDEVIKRQVSLISKWQLVGFIHGVMNTDNMTICGETIDYGPCAFMDAYNPKTVFSSIDHGGRYAYGNQPSIAIWNLARFAESLIPLLDEEKDKAIDSAKESINKFAPLFKQTWLKGMREKLGIFDKEDADEYLIDSLLGIMQNERADYTNTFYNLTIGNIDDLEIKKSDVFEKWYKLWQKRLERQNKSKDEIIGLMKKSNPVIIPRNHRVEEALSSAVENHDYSVMIELLEVLKNPFDYDKNLDKYRELPKATNEVYRTYCGT
ncbi:MAG: protein adenylyltransferase SelO [Sarcina sp.]